MKSYPTDRIRNVALVGHGGAGKTSLAEALLARSGTVARAGKVDDGTSLLDTEPESVKRKISLSLGLAPFEWKATDGNTYKINLIDTPGYVDFEAEVDAALAVADLAVFVVSAVDGVEVQTELYWRKCAALGIPRMVFVNKEDKDRADFHRVLDRLKMTFGAGFVALELPLGEAGTLHGVDLGGVSRTVRNALRGELTAPEARTPFQGFSATFAIGNGVLASDNLSFNTPDLRIPGLVVVDFPQRRIDARLAPRSAGSFVVFPFSARGPFAGPLAYDHDIGDRTQREVRAMIARVRANARAS